MMMISFCRGQGSLPGPGLVYGERNWHDTMSTNRPFTALGIARVLHVYGAFCLKKKKNHYVFQINYS